MMPVSDVRNTSNIVLCRTISQLEKQWTKTRAIDIRNVKSGMPFGVLYINPEKIHYHSKGNGVLSVSVQDGVTFNAGDYGFAVKWIDISFPCSWKDSPKDILQTIVRTIMDRVMKPMTSTRSGYKKYYRCQCCDLLGTHYDYPGLEHLDSVFSHKKAVLEYVRGNVQLEDQTSRYVTGYIADILCRQYRLTQPIPDEIIEYIMEKLDYIGLDNFNVFTAADEFVLAAEEYANGLLGTELRSCCYFVAKKVDGIYRRTNIFKADKFKLWKELVG